MNQLIGRLSPEDVENIPPQLISKLREGLLDLGDDEMSIGECLGNFLADTLEMAADGGCILLEGELHKDEEE